MDDGQQRFLRLDRWLWFTRFYKTRGLAAQAVNGGHVRINGERAKPGSKVRQGDIIDIVRGQLPFRLAAGPLPSRRGPANEAQCSYVEDDATRERREALQDGIRQDRQRLPRTDGRPDKHTRRLLRERGRSHGTDN